MSAECQRVENIWVKHNKPLLVENSEQHRYNAIVGQLLSITLLYIWKHFMISRILLLFLLFLLGFTTMAQTDSAQNRTELVDSLELKYGVMLFDTLPELADSVFNALKTRKFENLIPFIATAEMIRVEFDTLDLDYLSRLATVKAQYMLNQLRKQHIKLTKYAKVYHLNLRNMEIVNQRIREKQHAEGHTYGEVIFLCESGSHKFYITFVAIKIIDRWFLADELGIEEVTKPSGGR